jgi:hypothetical protein
MFDVDNIVVELEHKVNGRRFHNVGVHKEIRQANNSKAAILNGYKDQVNKRSF